MCDILEIYKSSFRISSGGPVDRNILVVVDLDDKINE